MVDLSLLKLIAAYADAPKNCEMENGEAGVVIEWELLDRLKDALQSALVGETGLSAIEEVHRLRAMLRRIDNVTLWESGVTNMDRAIQEEIEELLGFPVNPKPKTVPPGVVYVCPECDSERCSCSSELRTSEGNGQP